MDIIIWVERNAVAMMRSTVINTVPLMDILMDTDTTMDKTKQRRRSMMMR